MTNTYHRPRIVYGLRRPDTVAVRYVGQTRDPQKRVQRHINRPHHAALEQWIAELRRDGVMPELIILAHASNYDDACRKEQDWIASLSTVFGSLLLNVFHRGDFVPSSLVIRNVRRMRSTEKEAARIALWKVRRREWRKQAAAYRAALEARFYTHNGRTMLLSGWAKLLGISRERMRQRVNSCKANGIDLAEALTTPAGETMPSFRNPCERYRLRIAERNAKMIKEEWFDGKVRVIRQGRHWSRNIKPDTFRNIIQAEAEARGGKCKFRILRDHIMFVFDKKEVAAA